MQVLPSGIKGPGLFDDNAFGDNYMVDEVGFAIDTYDDLFGSTLIDPEQLLKNDGIDELFGTEDTFLSNSYPPQVIP